MLNCKQATELASHSLDRKLSIRQRISLKFHLLICHLCRAYVQHIKFIRRAGNHLDQHIESQTHHTLSSSTKARIKKELEH